MKTRSHAELETLTDKVVRQVDGQISDESITENERHLIWMAVRSMYSILKEEEDGEK